MTTQKSVDAARDIALQMAEEGEEVALDDDLAISETQSETGAIPKVKARPSMIPKRDGSFVSAKSSDPPRLARFGRDFPVWFPPFFSVVRSEFPKSGFIPNPDFIIVETCMPWGDNI